jgi:hypothetical protein
MVTKILKYNIIGLVTLTCLTNGARPTLLHGSIVANTKQDISAEYNNLTGNWFSVSIENEKQFAVALIINNL